MRRSSNPNQTPEKMESKRENRLQEFYSRSVRKDRIHNNINKATASNFINNSGATPQNRPNKALEIFNLSQQLDIRNKERHLGRNLVFNKNTSNMSNSITNMKKHQQRSYEKLPTLVQNQQNRPPLAPPTHPRGSSQIDITQRQINPITGIISPMATKMKAF